MDLEVMYSTMARHKISNRGGKREGAGRRFKYPAYEGIPTQLIRLPEPLAKVAEKLLVEGNKISIITEEEKVNLEIKAGLDSSQPEYLTRTQLAERLSVTPDVLNQVMWESNFNYWLEWCEHLDPENKAWEPVDEMFQVYED